MNRMRIIRWMVQPVVLADDGETLTEVPVQPIAIAHAQWETFTTEGWRQAVDELRRQIESPSEPTT